MRIATGASAASEIDKNTIGGGYYMARTYLPYTGTLISELSYYGNLTAVDSTGALITCSAPNLITNSTAQTAVLVKYNPTGSIAWQKRISGTGNISIVGIVVDTSNNIYVAVNRFSSPYATPYIVKYNASGTFQWEQKYYNPTYPTGGTSIIGLNIDSSNNLYATGSNYTGSKFANSTWKLTTSGAITWVKDLYVSGTNSDYADQSCVDSLGNIYVVGRVNSIFSPSYINTQVIYKYNSSGTIQWARQFTTGGYADMKCPVVDSNNDVYFTYSCPETPGTSNSRGFLMKFNSSGVLQWQYKLSTVGLLIGTIDIDTSNNVYVPTGSKSDIQIFDSSGVYQQTLSSSNLVTNMNVTPSPTNPFTLSTQYVRGINVVGTDMYCSGINLLQSVGGVYENSASWVAKLTINNSKNGIYAIPNQYSLQYTNDVSNKFVASTITDSALIYTAQNSNVTVTSSSDLTYTTGTLSTSLVS